MKNVTVTWKAFGKPTSNTIGIADEVADLQICEEIFEATNLRTGWMWYALERSIPTDRTHTALSVGDEIDIDGTIYRCAPIGWDVVGKYEVDHFALSERDMH